ncbi:MAG: sodium/proton antiporter NhaB [Succinivibrio sp.]|nr:sodium/proton antiporter NhaB [Succinivibrio sp.]
MSNNVSVARAVSLNFMGNAPRWYKLFIIFCLVLNPILASISPFVCGWVLVAEFIFTLAMALQCYPLQPGGILTLEACILGMCTMDGVKHEIEANLEVLLLLMFMLGGIHFVRDFLLFIFTKILVKVRSHTMIAFLFCCVGGTLAAFVDALTVLAVIISICMGLYGMYHKFICGDAATARLSDDHFVSPQYKQDLEDFRAFLRSILMHAAVGTTIGGVATLVGQPQNLIVGNVSGWNFVEFFLRMAPVTIPIYLCGYTTCIVLEKLKIFGFGMTMPESVYKQLVQQDMINSANLTMRDKCKLACQALCCVWLIFGLAFHLAAVGLIGLSIIVLATILCGINTEEEVGKAFTESMPFCSLLCVFFAVVTVIDQQQLFQPFIDWVFTVDESAQIPIFYLANGIISAVSDNVFVATIYIEQVHDALVNGIISGEHYNNLAIAINAGTNLPSVATPNGQAAFLFLLTSAIAPLIRLPYVRMMWMALPYTIVLTIVGLFGCWILLPVMDEWMMEQGWIVSGNIAHAAAVAAGAAGH